MIHAPKEQQQKEKTVLIVEDDASIGATVVLVLTLETPYHIELASDAFQALKMVEDSIPDLLILDYHLPVMNGLEFYDHLHAQEAFRAVPALFLSANAPKQALEQRHICLLSKPFEIETLLQIVEQLLAG